MKTRINLLPWREEQRKRQNTEFGIVAGAAALLSLGIVFSVGMYFDDRISYQQQRNSFIKSEIKVLESKLETIKELETTKQNLLDRMGVIQDLQGSRPEIVHLFETLVATIPDGVWLTSINQVGKTITLRGVTESNARVSALMRNLEESDWIASPKLVSIETATEKANSEFQLVMTQTSPNKSESEE